MGDTLEQLPAVPARARPAAAASVIPLHIFEDRYKHDDRRVPRARGASSGSSGSPTTASRSRLRRPHRPGARALRRRADEHPRARAPRPFRLLRRIEDCPIRPVTWSCSTTWPTATRPRPRRGPQRATRDLVERVTDERPDAESLDELDAYGMAATLDVAPDAKQSLLEQRSERDRLERLDAAVRRRARADRARGEGGRALARQRQMRS